MTAAVLRYSAAVPDGADAAPAGVVLGADFLDQREMLAIARAIGYPSTAFVLNSPNELGHDGLRLRYFSTAGELAFDAPATVAAATALAERGYDGSLRFETTAGAVRTTTVARSGRHIIRLSIPAGPGVLPAAGVSPAPEPLSGCATRVPLSLHEKAAIA